MTDPSSIALFSAAIAAKVARALDGALAGAIVRVGTPRPAERGTSEAFVFLYRVSPSVSLRNADLPSRSGSGRAMLAPQAALDLHYLVTFASSEPFQVELMIGAAASALHAAPLFTAGEMRLAATACGLPATVADFGAQRPPALQAESLGADECLRLTAALPQPPGPFVAYCLPGLLLDASGPTPVA